MRNLLGTEFFSYGALGIFPYLNSSLFIQTVISIVPSLARLQEEGTFGQRRIKQYIRLLNLLNSLFLGFVAAIKIVKPMIFGWNFYLALFTTTSLASGGLIHMYIADYITSEKLGNGSSIMLCTSIIGGFSVKFSEFYLRFRLFSQIKKLGSLSATTFSIGLLTYFITYGQRKYKKICIISTKTNKLLIKFDGSFEIIKGMLPIPYFVTGVLPLVAGVVITKFSEVIVKNFTGENTSTSLIFLTILRPFLFSVVTILFATLFTTFNVAPQRIANNLNRAGCLVSQTDNLDQIEKYIRPGQSTKKYLAKSIARVGFSGGVMLVILSFLFALPERYFGFQILSPVIILISTLTETFLEIQGYLLNTRYENFR